MKKLLVITSFPSVNGEGAKQNAVACYSQNLLSSYKDREIVVLSDIEANSKVYKKGNILVVPSWRPASISLFVDLFKKILEFSEIKDILIQFEFNMLGSVVLTSLFPFFLGTLRLIGKNITLVQHQVVNDLSDLSGHLDVKPDSFKNYILNSGLSIFYALSGLFANSIIVHEETLKQRLSKWVDINKIFVVPHGLSVEPISRSKNKEFTLLLFGYLSWYKGVDWLIEKVGEIKRSNPGLKIKLVVAGGPSATLKSKAHYLRFLNKIALLGEKEKETTQMIGYVPEKDVRKCFAKSDLVILPYRTLMSASGPLSFALRFGRPFMVSKALASSFNNSNLNSSFIFSLKGNDFERKIIKIINDKKLYARLSRYSQELAASRSWENIVSLYENAISAGNEALRPSFEIEPSAVS